MAILSKIHISNQTWIESGIYPSWIEAWKHFEFLELRFGILKRYQNIVHSNYPNEVKNKAKKILDNFDNIFKPEP